MHAVRPLALAAALAVALVPASTIAMSSAAETPATCAYDDLNGDGISTDTWVGDPDATAGGKAKAGAVWIRPANGSGGFGTAVRLTQGTGGVPGTPGTGDRYGAAIQAADLNADGCLDLVVSAPGEQRSGRAGAGSVSIVFGSPTGLGHGPAALTISAATTGATAQTDEHFGSALAVEDGDTPVVLAIGRPGRNVAGAAAAGAVTLLRFSAAGTVSGMTTITQNSANVGGNAEKGDRFGSAIGFTYFDLVVGVPGENTSKGIVQILTGSRAGTAPTASHAWSLDSKGVPGAPKAGDRFGAALAVDKNGITGGVSTIIGVPGRDVGSATNAGAIVSARIYPRFALSNSLLISQDSKDAKGDAVADKSETSDGFGSVVAYDQCWVSVFYECIVVGIPGEDVSGHKDAGAIWVMSDSERQLFGGWDHFLTQGTTGVRGTVQTGNRFGSALSLHWDRGLTVGVPGDLSYPHGSVVRLDWQLIFAHTSSGSDQWTPTSGVSAGAAL